jgi:hypothetical protein
MTALHDSRSEAPARGRRAGLFWLLGLVALSAAAIVWNSVGMKQTLTIDGRSGYAVRAIDDRDPSNHGNSVARLEHQGRALVLQCDVGNAAPYPFCEIHIQRAP